MAAALALFGMGSLITATGLVLTGQGLAYDDRLSPGKGEFYAGIGFAILLVGLIQAIAGIFVWAHRAWARRLGIVCAAVGAALGAWVLPTAFNPIYRGGANGELVAVPNVTALVIGLSLFPYVLIFVGLILGGAQFKRQDG